MIEIKISDLEILMNSHNLKDDESLLIEKFQSAINDWPKAITSVNEYITQIEIFIKGKSSKQNISIALNNIDYSKNAWEAESLCQIIELFDNKVSFLRDYIIKIDNIKNKGWQSSNMINDDKTDG